MKQLQTIATVFFGLVITAATSCSNDSKTATSNDTLIIKDHPHPAREITIFDKLVGTWKKEEGNSYEKWTRNDDGTYSAVAFSIKGTDTTWEENARIFPENNNWVFENTVRGQNDGKAIRFTSTKLDENTVQFSNPSHDFPTDINYTITNPRIVNAFIIGPNKTGGKDTIPFNYMRYTGG